jgi:DNA-binding transcriptional MerR regulator
MAWSTREIAELAGTSLRAVRHYHEVGLLEEPERRSNGYKQYGVAHLVRLLRIKRLVDLGFSLSEITAMGDADDHPEQALRTLDAELATTVERLKRARVELGLILRNAAPTDLPAELVPAAAVPGISDADRSFLVVMSRVLGPRGMESYAEVARQASPDPALTDFDDLPGDADEDTRQEMADRLAPALREVVTANPGLKDMSADAPRGQRFYGETVNKAMQDLYNPAQLDVMKRALAALRRAT